MRFALHLRIPAWSKQTAIRLNGTADPAGGGAAARPGSYVRFDRTWRDGDTVALELDMSLCHWSGELERAGKAALYTGPILLGFDQHWNAIDTNAIPPIDFEGSVVRPITAPPAAGPGMFSPIVFWEAQVIGGRTIFLCDFATCGVHGTDCVAWLPATNAGPPQVQPSRP